MELDILMKNLGITENQAKELADFDSAVDKMKSVKEINIDLNVEQAAIAKKARSAERKRTPVYKFDTSKREKKINEPKREIVAAIVNALENMGEVQIINEEREVIVIKDGVKFKLILSQPRT